MHNLGGEEKVELCLVVAKGLSQGSRHEVGTGLDVCPGALLTFECLNVHRQPLQPVDVGEQVLPFAQDTLQLV